MTYRHWLMAAGLTLVCMANVAQAQVVANRFNFSLLGGPLYFDHERELNNNGLGLLSLNYQFTQNWGIEAAMGFFKTHYNVANTHGDQGRLYLVDGNYYFKPDATFSPYLLAGVGVGSFNPNQPYAKYQANINAGIGLQYFADEIISLKVEARDFYTINGGYNDVVLMAGVNINLNWC